MSLLVVGKAQSGTRGTQGVVARDDAVSDVRPGASGANYDLRTLRHPFLENVPMFIELKGKLESYLEDRNLPIIKQKVLTHKSAKWREVLFHSLLVLLSEVTFTNDEAQQQNLLTKVKKWYDEKTALPSPLPSLVKRKDPVRPNSKRLSKSETPMKDQKTQFELRRLDAIPTIESRTPSPTKTPKLPRLVVSLNSRTFAGMMADSVDYQANAALPVDSIQEEAEKEPNPEFSRTTKGKPIKNEHVKLKNVPDQSTRTKKGHARRFQANQRSPDTEDDGESFVTQIRKQRGDRLYIQGSPQTSLNKTFGSSISVNANKSSLLQSSLRLEKTEASDQSNSDRGSSLTSPRKPIPERVDVFADLYQIKEKLAKSNIPCEMKNLEVGLIKPTDIPSELLCNLPSGGVMLMENPLDELSKAAKPKKKRNK